MLTFNVCFAGAAPVAVRTPNGQCLAGAGLVPALRKCSTNVFFNGWDVFRGPAQDRPLQSTSD